MFELVLNLLPKIGAGVAALPEFKALVDQALATVRGKDHETLSNAYELAKRNSDDAHNELQELVRSRTGG